MRIRRAALRPRHRDQVVLFVDDADWDCFFQLAAALRSVGYRTIRVTTIEQRRASRAQGLIFDEIHLISDESELDRIPELIGDRVVLDVQAVDTMAQRVFAALESLGPEQCSNRWRGRELAVDKWQVAQRLAEAGLSVPEVLDAASVTPAEAIAVLGLPIVLKDRQGSGGGGVSIHHSEADLVAACASDPSGSQARFYERFVVGRPLQYGCIATETGISASVTYETLARIKPLAPASRIELLADGQLLDVGARLVAALGIAGFVNVNVIRDEQERDWIHDVNPRVWGSFACFAAGGVHFFAAYVAWLQMPTDSSITTTAERRSAIGTAVAVGSSTAALASTAVGLQLDVMPCGLAEAFAATPGLFMLWQLAGQYRRELGLRYLLFEIRRQWSLLRQLTRQHRRYSARPVSRSVG